MKAPIPDITRDLFDLSGYYSIVTGASAGTGAAIAEALAGRGSGLVLVSRRAEPLEAAAGKIRAPAQPTGPSETFPAGNCPRHLFDTFLR